MECAIYGAEIVTQRMAIDDLNSLHYDLQMLGVPVDTQSNLFRNDKPMIINVSKH